MKHALALTGLLLCSPGVHAQTTYPLICRGSNNAAEPSMERGPDSYLVLKFQKGKQSAGAGLAPGHCAWRDRAIREDEPSMLMQSVATPSGQPADPLQLGWKEELRDPTAYWTFAVFNTGRGYFAATSAHATEIGAAEALPVRPKIDLGRRLPDLAIPKGGTNCPYGVNLIATGPAITRPFVVRLILSTTTNGEKLHRRTLDTTVAGISGARYVKLPFSKTMLGADTTDPIECLILVDATNQITETNERNNQAVIQIPSLLAADERQGH